MRVLFVAYGSAHIAKVAPVVRALEARGVQCTVMALTVGYHQAMQLGLKPVGYKDFMHLVPQPRQAMAVGRSLLAGNSHPNVDPHESACYLGVNYTEWIETHGEDQARQLYEHGGRRAFKPIRFMQRVIAALAPHVVVSTSSPRSEQAAIEASVALGVPSLTMMDSFALPAEPYHQHRVRADRVTVMSAVVKSNLVAMGMDPGRIVVTGCPAFDGHFAPQLSQLAEAFRARHGWDDRPVILWAGAIEESPGTPDDLAGTRLAVAVEQRLRAYAAQHNLILAIRYHPSQYHLFSPRTDQPGVYIDRPTEVPIELMLKVADTVVVQASTVGFEAALMGKRVLCLTYSPAVRFTGLDYAAMGYAEGIPSLDALLPTLSRPKQMPANTLPALPPYPAAPAVADEIVKLAQRLAGTR